MDGQVDMEPSDSVAAELRVISCNGLINVALIDGQEKHTGTKVVIALMGWYAIRLQKPFFSGGSRKFCEQA